MQDFVKTWSQPAKRALYTAQSFPAESMQLLKFTLLLIATLISLAGCGQNGLPTTDSAVSFAPNQKATHWTVINYWAKWCAPCREEIPELNAFAARHADSVKVLGVNYDGLQGEALTNDINALQIEFPVLLSDPHNILGIARPTALPSTVIISPDGVVTEILLGPQTEQSLAHATAQTTSP